MKPKIDIDALRKAIDFVDTERPNGHLSLAETLGYANKILNKNQPLRPLFYTHRNIEKALETHKHTIERIG